MCCSSLALSSHSPAPEAKIGMESGDVEKGVFRRFWCNFKSFPKKKCNEVVWDLFG